MYSESPDVFLRQYLAAGDPEAEDALARILERVAAPLVRRVVVSVVRDEEGEGIVGYARRSAAAAAGRAL